MAGRPPAFVTSTRRPRIWNVKRYAHVRLYDLISVEPQLCCVDGCDRDQIREFFIEPVLAV
jgi:hypothetical protein